MAAPARLGKDKLRLKFGTPAKEYNVDVKACTMENEDGEVQTFADTEHGTGLDWFFNITAVQSTDPDSLWVHIWNNSGQVVPFVFGPHGNDEATAAQPHFIGNVKIGPKPKIGGEAARKGSQEFETRWEIIGEPVLDTGE